MTEPRLRVLAEARSWLGTPYHHMGRVKGAGADCLTLLAEVYERAGTIGHVDIPFYPPDWHLHREVERYLEGLLGYAREIPWEPGAQAPRAGRGQAPAQAGDIALFKMGRCFAHGAIVTAWPKLIHALAGACVLEGDATQGILHGRAVRFFCPFGDRS